MKINWKVRLQHKSFLVALFAALLLLAQQVARALGYDLPEAVGEQATAIFNSVLGILVLLGVVVDPTTSAVSDSQKAMQYAKPKEDE